MTNDKTSDIGDGDDESGDVTDEEVAPQTSSKWLRVRRSRVVNVDKINQVAIQQRNGDFFLEIRADRDIHIPVPDLENALDALEALTRGEMDISAHTVSRSFNGGNGQT